MSGKAGPRSGLDCVVVNQAIRVRQRNPDHFVRVIV